MVAWANADVFLQIWIGADDKLPRKMRAIYQGDRAQLRHDMELSNWQLDQAVAADAFASPRAATATKVEVARPDPQQPAPLPKRARLSWPRSTVPAKARSPNSRRTSTAGRRR